MFHMRSGIRDRRRDTASHMIIFQETLFLQPFSIFVYLVQAYIATTYWNRGCIFST